MIIVYIAHPISGNIEENLADLRRIVRKINLEYHDIVPFVPYYADIVSMDDNILAQRKRGMQNDTEILTRKGVVDQLWLTGNKISTGMKAETALARFMEIPVLDYINKL